MKNIEPYRFLFPVGWLLGFLGVLIWLPWFLKPLAWYPGQIHPELMIGGFLLMYAFGFLTTAIPRFTGTQEMSRAERAGALALALTLLLSFAFLPRVIILCVDLLIIIYLMLYALKRFRKSTAEPPPSFIFIGIGLSLAFFGLLFQILSQLWLFWSPLARLSRPLFYVGFMLSLVLGIGSRLIPGLLGHQPVPTPILPGKNKSHSGLMALWARVRPDMKGTALLFLLSFVIESAGAALRLGDLLRALATSYIAFKYWKLAAKPKSQGFMYLLLWLSAWMVMLSQVLMALLPDVRLESLHLLYISGLGLMTLMISTRVTLSHSGQDLSLEKKSVALLATGILVLAAALFRFSAFMMRGQFHYFLLLASLLWCLGLLTWLARFGRYWRGLHHPADLPNQVHQH